MEEVLIECLSCQVLVVSYHLVLKRVNASLYPIAYDSCTHAVAISKNCLSDYVQVGVRVFRSNFSFHIVAVIIVTPTQNADSASSLRNYENSIESKSISDRHLFLAFSTHKKKVPLLSITPLKVMAFCKETWHLPTKRVSFYGFLIPWRD